MRAFRLRDSEILMTEKKKSEGTQQPWYSVSIAIKKMSCDEAKGMDGRRFLSKQAPRLPLSGCTRSEHCPCTYRHHQDRRAGPRREEEQSGLRRPARPERRGGHGRRKLDG